MEHARHRQQSSAPLLLESYEKPDRAGRFRNAEVLPPQFLPLSSACSCADWTSAPFRHSLGPPASEHAYSDAAGARIAYFRPLPRGALVPPPGFPLGGIDDRRFSKDASNRSRRSLIDLLSVFR